MKKILRYLAAMTVTALALACEPENTTNQEENENNGSTDLFTIEILDLHSSYCSVKVTPKDLEKQYFLGVTTKAYFGEFGSEDDLEGTVTNFIETEILNNSDLTIAEIMHKGIYERPVTGLQPEQTFVVFACHTDETGAVVSDIEIIEQTTPKLSDSDMTFDIEIDQITATSAMLFITPSTDDQYVWMELPEFVYKDFATDDELEAFLVKNYKAFFPLHSTSGEKVHSFDDKLDPDTEYMVIVFGYDGGVTTPLATKKFRTLKPNNAENVTFDIKTDRMTSRSVTVTFTPSDNTVSYFAIVADEDMLAEISEEVSEESVKALIDYYAELSIEEGECADKKEFVEYNSCRGKQTINYALTPGLKHYACAVCVDSNGEYNSDVAIVEFTAPEEGSSANATVTASFSKWFDGDALAASDSEQYGDYTGWAVVPVTFRLGGSASKAIYTVYPVKILEEEGATDDIIRELLLDNTLLGEFNFYAESLETILLEWNCDYRLYAIALDEDDNTGEMFTLDIPALSKDGASPAEEY